MDPFFQLLFKSLILCISLAHSLHYINDEQMFSYAPANLSHIRCWGPSGFMSRFLLFTNKWGQRCCDAYTPISKLAICLSLLLPHPILERPQVEAIIL
jgi:hypothetical protein